jgi:DNA-binding MarR family transcriptional regulator/GNAT superfamily N-acetyltransferase
MSDLLIDQGCLALGSRMKRIFDRLAQEGGQIYECAGVDFKPTWFPIFLALRRESPLAMGRLADLIQVSHVAVNQVVKELSSKGLVRMKASKTDKRVRLIELTPKGFDLLKEAEKVWPVIRAALESAVAESERPLVESLNRFEAALDRQSFSKRFVEAWNDGIEIIPFEADLRSAFYEINRDWIEKYFVIEAPDLVALENPEAILEGGGEIYFARDRMTDRIIGTCALMRHGNEWELAKMGVVEEERGRGAGRKLGEAVLDHARRAGIKEVFLGTNSSLKSARALYEKLGFVEKPFPFVSEYQRADVYMVIQLER